MSGTSWNRTDEENFSRKYSRDARSHFYPLHFHSRRRWNSERPGQIETLVFNISGCLVCTHRNGQIAACDCITRAPAPIAYIWFHVRDTALHLFDWAGYSPIRSIRLGKTAILRVEFRRSVLPPWTGVVMTRREIDRRRSRCRCTCVHSTV